MGYVYRKVNPHNIDDINKYLEIQQKLNQYLHSKAKPLSDEQIKWLRIRMGAFELLDAPKTKDKELANRLENQMDEVCFLCELNDEVIGFCAICNYHVVNGERPDDDIGMISDIYVKDGFRSGEIAYNLLKLGIDELINAGKTSAIVVVQEDNPNRFLHFAIADKVLESEVIKRNNNTKTINYDLLISDLAKVKTMTARQLGAKAVKIKRDFINNNLTQPRFIKD